MERPANATTDAAPPAIAVAVAPGAMVAGRYRLEARLGAGGGGTVWRCRDEKLGAIVALKIVGADGDVERWRREVAMARRIASRHVCRVHDLGDAGELRFVTMELVEGNSLRARLQHRLPPAVARDLFVQIVAGAAAIHAAGVVHRDLKPENIVVDRHDRAVIVDFGLARERGSPGARTSNATIDMRASISPRATITHAGVAVGTPGYMSPEQAAGQAVDARTDVWALGLIGHELLAGTLPRPDEHGRAIDPVVDACWQGVTGVLRRCLAFLPEERFADARQLEHALATLGRRGRSAWRLATVVLGAVAIATIAAAAILAGDRTRAAEPRRAPPSRAPQMFQITTTEPRQWPAEAPISVALSPDATRFAYTTAQPRLLVRSIEGGAPEPWSLPALEKPRTRPGAPPESVLAMMWVAGWFSDGSLAIIGTRREGTHELYRVHADGRTQLLHRHPRRFVAAVSPTGDRVAIGRSDHAIVVVAATEGAAPEPIATTERDHELLALAWSPDGSQLATARLLGESADAGAIHVMSSTGAGSRELWRGALGGPAGQLLVWLDRERLAFASNDLTAGRARLFTLHLPGAVAQPRGDWSATYVGAGTAAGATLLLLRGPTTSAVVVGNKRAQNLVRLHDRGVRARHVAGWTSDGHVVFAVGDPGRERIVRGAPGEAIQPWPGTRDGVELPDTLVDDDLITHRVDPGSPGSRQIVIDRITPTGARTELARLPASAPTASLPAPTANPPSPGDAATPSSPTFVRCAGDRTPPCVLMTIEDSIASWNDLDPRTGTRGPRLHQRPIRQGVAPSVALSVDGQLLAIIDGGDTITLIDRATGKQQSRTAGEGVPLHSLAFAPDGTLWVTALAFRGRLFGVMTFDFYTDHLSSFASQRGTSSTDILRHYDQPRPSPDGDQLAISTLDLELDIWRTDGQ